MIGLLHGKLLEITPPIALVDVSGIGYEVNLPLSHIAQLGLAGQDVVLYTHLVIREDSHALYGFLLKSERDCFRQLTKVSGVGAKIGLALLSTMNSSQIQLAIDTADLNSLCLTPGIGKKMAERIVLELKGKLGFSNMSLTDGIFAENTSSVALVKQDITNALESLGYASKEIVQVLKQIGEVSDLSDGIKKSLQLLSKF